MERAAWTDERLDDLIDGMRNGFGRVDQDVRDLRTELGALRSEMHEGFGSLRVEIKSSETGLRSEINELRRVMIGMSSGIIVALIGVIAVVLARGA